jgi:uncharacterized protein
VSIFVPQSPDQLHALSDEETDELDQFLMSDAVSDGALALDSLDGYLTAIAIGPVTQMPSDWLPGVLGDEGQAPHFATQEQARRIMELILRHMNGIISTMQDDTDAFEPIFGCVVDEEGGREYLDGEMWAAGFMFGLSLCRHEWQPLFADPQGREWLRPLYLLGAEEVSEAEQALVSSPEQREQLSGLIPASVAAIYRYWLPHRRAADADLAAAAVWPGGPRAGRDQPCPCGSGRRFRHCCGAAAPLH